MNEVPFYLRPNTDPEPGVLLTIPIYTSPAMGGSVYTGNEVSNVWESLRDAAGDTLSGAKEAVVETVATAWAGVKDIGAEIGDTALSGVTGIFWRILPMALVGVGVVLVLVWVLGKSGAAEGIAAGVTSGFLKK